MCRQEYLPSAPARSLPPPSWFPSCNAQDKERGCERGVWGSNLWEPVSLRRSSHAKK